MRRTRIQEMRSVPRADRERLAAAGIRHADRLLETGCTGEGRERLAEETGIHPSRLLHWVHLADLCRVKGVGPDYADLLEAADCPDLETLQQAEAETLAARLLRVNRAKRVTRRTPNLKDVSAWLDDARRLAQKVLA